MTELLRLPINERRDPKVEWAGLGDGNYLAFAIANRWLSNLVFVIGGRHEDYWWEPEEPTGRPADLLVYLHKDFDLDADLELRAIDAEQLRAAGGEFQAVPALAREPIVPFNWTLPRTYRAAGPFTYVTVARSPAFTPATADPLYEEICRRFMTDS